MQDVESLHVQRVCTVVVPAHQLLDLLRPAFTTVDEAQLAARLIRPADLPIVLQAFLALPGRLQNLYLRTMFILGQSDGLQNSFLHYFALSIDLVRLQLPQKQLELVLRRVELGQELLPEGLIFLSGFRVFEEGGIEKLLVGFGGVRLSVSVKFCLVVDGEEGEEGLGLAAGLVREHITNIFYYPNTIKYPSEQNSHTASRSERSHLRGCLSTSPQVESIDLV